MSPLYCFQFIVYSLCIYLFIIYSYVVYYSDLLSVHFRQELLPEYDYIIVGSGTAGSLIAHRLATETNHSFIVLEAGSRGQALMDMPIVGPVIHRSLFDWMYESVPQQNACWAMRDKKCRLFQGKLVGGSSKLNNMIHIRGNITHYTEWFRGKHTEKYIKQQFDLIENNIINIDNLKYESDLASAVLKAAENLGFKILGSKFESGFCKSKLSQRNGKRWSTSDNLDISKHVVSHALVEKVVIKDKIAVGVKFRLGDKQKYITAKQGVVISAGTFNSPKILQLSGIGPSHLLKNLKINQVVDLPVGRNLQDHIGTGLDLIVLNNIVPIPGHAIVNPINSFKYFFQGKGPLTTPGCEVIGFVSTKNVSTPDLQFMVLPTGITADRGSRLSKSLGIKDEIWNEYFVKLFEKHTASMVPIILHPKSKGTVFINSTDPEVPPLIDPQYLSHKEDRELLINGLKFIAKFLKTEAMKEIGAAINDMPFPGCENHGLFTDTYWDCYIKHLTLSIYHPVGTCSMGLPGSSVVDTNFRVHGVDNLFVADASVLPTLPSGNINAAVAMMASIFFESNIKHKFMKDICDKDTEKIKIDLCHRDSLLKELLFQICLSY